MVMKMRAEILYCLNFFLIVVAGQQNEYNLVFDSMEIVSYDKDIVENPVLTVFKYNETSQGVNASGVLKKDLGMDIKVNLDARKLQDNNEYKQMYNMNEVDMCDVLNRNQFGLKDLLVYGNFTVCPWKANTYVINNAMIDSSKLPPKAPLGKYLVEIRHFSGTTEIMHTKFTGSVVAKS